MSDFSKYLHERDLSQKRREALDKNREEFRLIADVISRAGTGVERNGRDMHDWLAQVLQVLVGRAGVAEAFPNAASIATDSADFQCMADANERAGAAATNEPLFYIQNRGYCGNCLRFWRVDGHGYTLNLREAWKVTEEQARVICRSRPEEDIMWPVEVLEAIAETHVTCAPARAAGVRL